MPVSVRPTTAPAVAPARPQAPAAPVAPPAARPLASHRYQVKTGAIGGAYYRKVQSDFSKSHRGIRAEGTLPQVAFDPARQFVSPSGLDHFQTGPLDRPSVYLGGNAGGHETDVGLTWDRVYDAQGRATYTDRPNGSDGRDPAHRFTRGKEGNDPVVQDGNGKVVARGKAAVDGFLKGLRPNFAFRPYWRTTNDGGNQWNQPKVGAPDNLYFYPGERFAMNVREGGPGQLRLDIRLDGLVHQHFSAAFRQEGFGVGKAQSFKRIMSIDQFRVEDGQRKGNEKRDVLPTRTRVTGGRWDEVSLLGPRGQTTALTGSRFTEVRGRDTGRRYGEIFHTSGLTSRGGESLDITPPSP